MKKAAVVVLVLAAFLLSGFGPGLSYAEKSGAPAKVEKVKQDEDTPPYGMMRKRGMAMMDMERQLWKALKDLGLSEKQKETIRDIRNKSSKEAIRKGADMRIARIELRELLDKEPVDMAAVEAKLKQLEPMRTELYLSMLKTLEEIKSVLTPEQRVKFKTNIKRQLRFGDRWMGEDREAEGPAPKAGKK